MTWLLIATGFSGAFTFLFIFKKIAHLFTTPKTIAVHFSPAGGCADALINEIQKKALLCSGKSTTCFKKRGVD